MATRTITRLEDDLDGSDAQETVEFGLDGATYSIDLSAKNAKKLRGALDDFVTKARKTSGSQAARRTSRNKAPVDTRAVRAWANGRGIEVSSRGRIPEGVINQFRDAGN